VTKTHNRRVGGIDWPSIVPFVLARLGAVWMLFTASERHPIGFYTYLRFVVCGTCVYGAFYAYRCNRPYLVWLMSAVAVLFNPFFQVHLGRPTWGYIDPVIAIFLLVSIPLLTNKDAGEKADESNKG